MSSLSKLIDPLRPRTLRSTGDLTMITIRQAARAEPEHVLRKTTECFVSAFTQVKVNMALYGNSMEAARQRSSTLIDDFASYDVYLAESEDKEVVGFAMWKPPSVDVVKDTSSPRNNNSEEAFNRFLALLPPDLATCWRELVPEQAKMFASTFGDDAKLACHLAVLCVHPDHQGKGIARKLVTPGIQKALAQDRKLHLDTSNDDLVNMYKRFGFHVRGQMSFTLPGPKTFTSYAMVYSA